MALQAFANAKMVRAVTKTTKVNFSAVYIISLPFHFHFPSFPSFYYPSYNRYVTVVQPFYIRKRLNQAFAEVLGSG